MKLRRVLIQATVLIFLSLLSAGCRFGNHIQSPTNSDQITGYYETAPQSLKFCANSGTETCVDANPSLTPSVVASIMTDPVRLIMLDLPTHTAALAAINSNSAYMEVQAMDNGSITYVGQPNTSAAWDTTACVLTVSSDATGKWAKSNGPFTSGTQGTYPLSGRISLDMRVSFTFTGKLAGSCTSSLQAMSSCYADVTTCDPNSQSYVKSIFQPFIDAKAMTSAGIATTTALAYEVLYQ